MTRRFAICLAIASSVLMAPRPAAAATTTTVFDTIDSVEFIQTGYSSFYVTGIVSGQSASTTQRLDFETSNLSQRCERSALMVISKPGKYRLRFVQDTSSGVVYSCTLIRTP